MEFPFLSEMSEAQRVLFNRRLELEQKEWELRKEMAHAGGGCPHVVIKGRVLYSPAQEKVVWTHEGLADDWNDGCYNASCAICGQDFGWWCPKSPNHICEYEGHGHYGCKFCGEPDERK